MKTLEERQAAVALAWNTLQETDPDLSTEQLIARVADITGEDAGDVAGLYFGEGPAET
jgi:hypothetical protein